MNQAPLIPRTSDPTAEKSATPLKKLFLLAFSRSGRALKSLESRPSLNTRISTLLDSSDPKEVLCGLDCIHNLSHLSDPGMTVGIAVLPSDHAVILPANEIVRSGLSKADRF
jgi:hypothetical protein